MVIPGVTTYSANTNVSTSSDPILAVMNGVLTTQNSQPKISINDVTEVQSVLKVYGSLQPLVPLPAQMALT